MEIKTRYSIEQDVYAIVDDKPGRYEVDSIQTITHKNSFGAVVTSIHYGLHGDMHPGTNLPENQVFETEEEMFEEISQRLK